MTDQLGSPRVLVDSLGQVVSRRDFMPFGEEIFPDGTHRKTADKYTYGDDVRQKFTGYQKDEETQLDFAEARMYQNLHARFTAVDPLLASGKSANPQTFNRYVYVVNNPLIFVDPDGLQIATAAGKVYQKGDNFAIFRGKPYDGYKPVTRTINTQTTIGGVQHHLTVTRNGWTVGDRIDGATFASPAASPPQGPPVENAAIRNLSTSAATSSNNALIGLRNGAVNTVVETANALNPIGKLTGLEIPTLQAENAQQKGYEIAFKIGFGIGTGVAGGTVFGGTLAMPTVVPNTTVPRYLYHYTSPSRAALIDETGQIGLVNRPNYFTNNGNLSPVQAQIELALPQQNTATIVFRVDTSKINFSPYSSGRVAGNVNNRAGGGTEFIFNRPIPRSAFERLP